MGPRTVLVPHRTSKHVRIALGGLAFVALVQAVFLALVVLWVLGLRAERDHLADVRQAQINATLCQLTQGLPDNSPTIARIRSELRCPVTGAP